MEERVPQLNSMENTYENEDDDHLNTIQKSKLEQVGKSQEC